MHGSRDVHPVGRTRARPCRRRTDHHGALYFALRSTPAFSPPAGKEIIPAENVPPLDADFIKSLKKLGKLASQIAHINDAKEWELGKLHKLKTKEIPAPAGGMAKVRHQYKFKNITRDQFFRLRMSEYGATATWVALKKQRRS